jgi:hypothetical protein
VLRPHSLRLAADTSQSGLSVRRVHTSYGRRGGPSIRHQVVTQFVVEHCTRTREPVQEFAICTGRVGATPSPIDWNHCRHCDLHASDVALSVCVYSVSTDVYSCSALTSHPSPNTHTPTRHAPTPCTKASVKIRVAA